MSNYDKHAARRLMAENPGMNYTAALRTVRERWGEAEHRVSQTLLDPQSRPGQLPHLAIAGPSGSGKSVLVQQIMLSHLLAGHDVFLSDWKWSTMSSYPFTDWLAAPFAKSTEETQTLLETVISGRDRSRPALVVIEDLAYLDEEAIGDVNILARMGRSLEVRLAVTSQSTEKLSDRVLAGSLFGKVLMGLPRSERDTSWIGFAPSLDDLPLRGNDKGFGLYSDPDSDVAQPFRGEYMSAVEIEAVLRAASVPTREERDR